MVRSDLYRFASADATHITAYIRNVQSCFERLASADVDPCTAMKFECAITVMNPKLQ